PDGASPGKIIRFRRTTVFAADNMVHLAAPERILLVDQTILADMVRPLSDETAQPLANLPAHGPAVRGRGPWLAASDALSLYSGPTRPSRQAEAAPLSAALPNPRRAAAPLRRG